MKTKVTAEKDSQDLLITREFQAPVALLFKAFTEKNLFEKWVGTRLVKLDCQAHGSYRFETSGPEGHVLFSANGTFHEVLPNQRITRTFEMENSPFPVQLEFLEFEALSERSSQLIMQILFRSAEHRNQLMQLPFAQGLNQAHNRLQALISQ